jgi:hypothetical protein
VIDLLGVRTVIRLCNYSLPRMRGGVSVAHEDTDCQQDARDRKEVQPQEARDWLTVPTEKREPMVVGWRHSFCPRFQGGVCAAGRRLWFSQRLCPLIRQTTQKSATTHLLKPDHHSRNLCRCFSQARLQGRSWFAARTYIRPTSTQEATEYGVHRATLLPYRALLSSVLTIPGYPRSRRVARLECWSDATGHPPHST